jgi:hypothetical protein
MAEKVEAAASSFCVFCVLEQPQRNSIRERIMLTLTVKSYRVTSKEERGALSPSWRFRGARYFIADEIEYTPHVETPIGIPAIIIGERSSIKDQPLLFVLAWRDGRNTLVIVNGGASITIGTDTGTVLQSIDTREAHQLLDGN